MGRTLSISLLILAVAAGAFFAGRFSAQSSGAANQTLLPPSIPSAPTPKLKRHTAAVHQDPHAALLQALKLPAEERKWATRRAMHAWLVDEGAAALRAARDDPRLAEVIDMMMLIALVVDPDIFIEDPSLLKGIAFAEQPIAADADSIAALSQDLARAALLVLQSGGEMGLGAEPYAENGGPLSVAEAYAEVEIILTERSPIKRQAQLRELVSRLAQSHLADAVALVDSLPAADRQHAIDALIDHWAESDPEAAAFWLANQQDQTSAQRFTQLAQSWGKQDFHSANAFAASLPSLERLSFLEGLASTIQHLPNQEKLAWLASFESEPNYPNLAASVATLIGQEDAGAAMSLIETLPPVHRTKSYSHVVPNMVIENPEAAWSAIDAVADPAERDLVVSIFASLWAQMDPDRAVEQMLELPPGPVRDRALASLAQGLSHLDEQEGAIGAFEEAQSPALRRGRVTKLLGLLEDEREAIRLGSEHGLDRQAVLEVRANST